MKALKVVISNHPVLACFTMTFAISWGGALPAIGGAGGMQGATPAGVPRFAYALIAMLAGPSLTGILLTALHRLRGVKDFGPTGVTTGWKGMRRAKQVARVKRYIRQPDLRR